MKYIKTLNEAKYTSAFQKMNKLGYNDQISGRKSLSKTLGEDLGFDPKKEYAEGVGFDSVSLYDVKSGKTIIEDALSGKYTYDEILAKAKDWYKKNESVNENAKATAKEIFDELMDVNGEEIADMDKSECMYTLKMRGITGGEANRVCKELLKMTSSIGESLTEAKKFKPGDKWSNDFDYEGMLKYALKTSIKTPIKTLNKLFDSATDVNYHTPFRNLGIAIDWIEDGDKEGAKDYMDSFIEDIKKEIKG